MRNWIILVLIFSFPSLIFGQAASLSDGDNIYYYATINEAFKAAEFYNSSIDKPIEITLIEDIVLNASLVISDNKHIILVPGTASVTIQRSADNIDFPLIWIRGESASVTLGKPEMEYELIIDGGNLNDPPILAHAPLITINGRNSKLIMHGKVTLQNNHNVAAVPTVHQYQNGAAVYPIFPPRNLTYTSKKS